MSYEDLAAHADEIKQLAIDKTIDMGIQASAGAAAYGGTPPIGLIEDMANQQFAGTEAIFDDWLGLPNPDSMSGKFDALQTAVGLLSAEGYLTDANAKAYAGGGGTSLNISQIEPTGAFMQGWQSGTATNYATFAGLFGPVTANLSVCAAVLRGVVDAEKSLWDAARTSVDELAHATKDALEHCTDKDPGDISMALTVLGAVAGIVAVPFTAGGSLVAGYTFAAIAAGTSVGGAFVPDAESRDGKITGDTPREIVNSLIEQLTQLNEDIVQKEQDIVKAASDSLGDFSAALGLDPGTSPVKMPRPTVADNPSFGGHD